MKSKTKSKFLMYKNKPLVRHENVIYYGNPNDKFLLRMIIKEDKPLQDINLSTKLNLQLLENNGELKIIKSSEKEDFYLALDLGIAWLDRALAS